MGRFGKVVLPALLLLPSLALARQTNSWQSVDGSYDGKWSETGHWSLGRLPEGNDYVEFDGDHQDAALSYTVEIDGDYELAGEFCVGRDGKTRKHTLTFAGDGRVTFSAVAEHNMRACTGGIVFDGPSLAFRSGGLMLFSPLSVRNGSRIEMSSRLYFWHTRASLAVGRGGCVEAGSVSVRTGANSGGLTVGAGGSFVCRGRLIDVLHASSTTNPFFINVSGGDVWCQTLDFSSRDLDTLTVEDGGCLTVWKTVKFADRAKQLAVAAGGHFVEPTDVTQGDENYALMTNRRHEVVSCTIYNAVDGVRFRQKGTFCVARLYNTSSNKPMYIDCDRLVFNGTRQPINWIDTDMRDVHFYGPMEIQATADITALTYDNQNGFRYCHGAVVVNTADWAAPATKRTIAIRGLASADGSLDLTVTGGGTFMTCQHAAWNSMRSCRVTAGTTLSLQDRNAFSVYGKNVVEWGALTTEKLVLEGGATVSFNAGLNYIAASAWEVDETAQISVTVPDGVPETVWALPILQDLDSKPLSAQLFDRISLSGATAGWTLKNEYGQITLWREPTAAAGIHSNPSNGEYEWKGGAGDAKFTNSKNWFDATGIAEKKKFTFGASTNAAVNFNGIGTAGGATAGSFCFQTNAVRSFFIDGSQTTFNNEDDHDERAIDSYSPVPQVLACGLRMSLYPRSRELATHDVGPLVFSRYRADGTTASKQWANANYSFIVKINGDVRVGCGMNATADNRRFGLALEPRSGRYPCYRSAFTVIDGGDIAFPSQANAFTNVQSVLRVSRGGRLSFPAEATHYGWEREPAAIVVDGTLDIGTRFLAGARQVYTGSGNLYFRRETQPNNASTRVAFGEALQVNITSNRWPSEGKTLGTTQHTVALGAVSGAPTIHVPADWLYAPTVESTIRSDELRAFFVENGAVATIEPNGGTATIDEKVTGFGTLAVTNGTLFLKRGLLNGTEDELGFIARTGATLEFAGSQSFGSLTLEHDATLKMPATASLTLDGDAVLDGATLDVGDPGTAWRTLISAKGKIVGTPTLAAADDVKLRTVVTTSGMSLQCKTPTGAILIFR